MKCDPATTGQQQKGVTLVELLLVLALSALAALMLYPVFIMASVYMANNRQKQEAQNLAMDHALEIFNTADFKSILLATNLPVLYPPQGSLLTTNAEIRSAIVPNISTGMPHKWDVVVRVKRDRVFYGGKRRPIADVVFIVTRYNIDRN